MGVKGSDPDQRNPLRHQRCPASPDQKLSANFRGREPQVRSAKSTASEQTEATRGLGGGWGSQKVSTKCLYRRNVLMY